MFENNGSKCAKQKQKEKEWEGVFKQLKEEENDTNSNCNQIDDKVFSNEQNEMAPKKIHEQMDGESTKRVRN